MKIAWIVIAFTIMFIAFAALEMHKEKAHLEQEEEKAQQEAMNQTTFFMLHESVRRATRTDEIRLSLNPNKKPLISDSKIGGTAYWPEGKSYPIDSTGVPMTLLAQFNCAEIPKTGKLPDSGMLQFFVSQDNNLEGKVVYHKTLNLEITEKSSIDAGALDFTKLQKYESPVLVECSVEARLNEASITIDDYQYDSLRKKLSREIGIPLIGEEHIPASVIAEICKESEGHHLLGYPYFTQGDPRTADMHKEVLLFQLDSEMRDKKDLVLWGDAGVGNYFISGEDLANQNFDNVFFTWDCC